MQDLSLQLLLLSGNGLLDHLVESSTWWKQGDNSICKAKGPKRCWSTKLLFICIQHIYQTHFLTFCPISKERNSLFWTDYLYWCNNQSNCYAVKLVSEIFELPDKTFFHDYFTGDFFFILASVKKLWDNWCNQLLCAIYCHFVLDWNTIVLATWMFWKIMFRTFFCWN